MNRPLAMKSAVLSASKPGNKSRKGHNPPFSPIFGFPGKSSFFRQDRLARSSVPMRLADFANQAPFHVKKSPLS
jgi:hypothetical protein